MSDAQKIFIKNRKEQKIAVLVEPSSPQRGLVFVMHGLGGFKEQTHIETFADAFKEKKFTVVRFDTTNSIGESEGKMEDATITSSFADLEDLIEWARTASWYQEPFTLVGHSMGAICSALYAEKYSEQVMALAPISTVVSGKLSIEALDGDTRESFRHWRQTGWRVTESASKPGVIKRIPWSHVEDRLKYDLISDAAKLSMPVLLMVGDQDENTPSKHIKMFYEALPGPKEFHIIPGAPHTFRDPKHL